MPRNITLLSLLLLLPAFAWSQAYFTYPENHNTRYIHSNETHFPLNEEAMLWIDHKDIHPTLEEIHHGELKEQFGEWPEKMPQWNNGKDQWIRLSAYNSSSDSRKWVLHLGKSDWATVWVMHEQGDVEKHDTGRQHSFEEDSWIDRNGEVSIPIEVQARKAVTVYARMSNQGAKPPLLAPYLQENSRWAEQHQLEALLQLFMLAIVLIALGVNLPALIWQRKASHVFFMLFALFFAAWVLQEYGYLRTHFLEGMSMWNWRVGTLAFIFAQPFFLLFTYLQLDERPPMLQLWVGVRISLSLALVSLSLLNLPLPLDWIIRSFWILDGLVLAYCSLGGGTPIMREGKAQDRWVLGSGLWLYVFLLSGSLLENISLRWGMPLGQPYDLYAYQIAGTGALLMYIWSTLRYAVNADASYPAHYTQLQSERA